MNLLKQPQNTTEEKLLHMNDGGLYWLSSPIRQEEYSLINRKARDPRPSAGICAFQLKRRKKDVSVILVSSIKNTSLYSKPEFTRTVAFLSRELEIIALFES